MAQIDVLKAQIVRNNLSTPWGFRLQGGAEHGQALSLMRVTPGSPAARIGLKSGDEVTEIGDVPTENMSQQEAYQYINQYGESLILTVERRASGRIPNNPVVTPGEEHRAKSYEPYDMAKPPSLRQPRRHPMQQNTAPPPPPPEPTMVGGLVGYIQVAQPGRPPSPPPPPKNYQTYDFNRPTRQGPPPRPKAYDYDFQTVQARPYEQPASRPVYQTSPQQQSAPPQSPTNQQQPSSPSHMPVTDTPHYSNYDFADAPDGSVSQSRTFKVLQSLMEGEEPPAGVQGLPPPRSAAMDRMKQEEAAKRAQQRVKVLMPQQYNSPLGMYSAKNVVETFTSQAEGYMDSMDRAEEDRVQANQQYQQQPVYGQHYSM